MELITKKQKLKNAIAEMNWQKALNIAKGFFLEFTKDEQRILQIAHETFYNESRTNFYTGMGIDVDNNHKQAIKILKKYK